MKSKKIETIIRNFKTPEILSINYNLENIEIQYSVDEFEEYFITFNNPIGFKCLHERDLGSFWKDKKMVENWIVEILEGGWLKTEIDNGFISNHIFEVREFLIKGIDDCVTVFASNEPIIRKI
ncbi:hypothetical protein [Alistipes sp. ZOR0009]|uniref:hypothetical protein n=1 Tax=Alistipes sp. ZOR0009 TaxID=1339253 RepID=UPI0006456ED9|nr:hypothetical protein [Alistipes sp. ZOR0009]